MLNLGKYLITNLAATSVPPVVAPPLKTKAIPAPIRSPPKIKDKLYTRDYYSKTTYFRLFIPNLYPQYNKVLYLDSDITILSDVADLYNIDIGDNLIAAAPDDVIQTIEVFQDYVEKVVGVADYRNYFNAGIIVMNLDELRKFDFQEKFLYLLSTVKFYSTFAKSI